MKRQFKFLMTLVIISLFISSCRADETQQIPTDTTGESTTQTTTVATVATTATDATAEEIIIPDSKVTLLMAGDNLIHSPIYNEGAARANGDGYDFSRPYKAVEEYVQSADLAILNQETVVNSLYAPSSYPRFSTPLAMGEHMINIGFDVFNMANNHVLDVEIDGLLASLDYWDSKEVTVFGAYRNSADMEDIGMVEKNGITFAFIGVTEHTNGLSIPSNSDVRVLYIEENEDDIKRLIEKADKIADVVVVTPHFGVEVSNTITDSQLETTRKFVEWGADLIIGTQPHTVQSMEFLPKPDGGKAFVFYCLGNFISSMSSPKAMVGMLGELTVVKNGETGAISFEEVKAIPIISQYESGYKDTRIILYKDYTEELARNHGVRSVAPFSKEFVDNIISENIPSQFLAK